MKRSISWPNILAEGGAIVVSILLAFSIDAWWANQETHRSLKENLVALKEELEANRYSIEQELRYRHAVIASIDKINFAIDSADALSAEEIDKLLGHLNWIGHSEFSTGALESILHGGLFAKIRDIELQRLLAGLPALYENVEGFEYRDSEFTLGPFFEFINANGSYNQIVNGSDSVRPGAGDVSFDAHFPVVEPRDHSNLLKSDSFLGLLSLKHANHSDVVYNIERLKPKLNRAIVLIEENLTD